MVAVGLVPDGLGLGFHAAHGAKDADGAVQDAQRALHLGCKIHVARGINDIKAVFRLLVRQADNLRRPVGGGGGRGDGDAPFLLLLHPIHRGCAVVNLSDGMLLAGVEQNPFGQGGLARVNMGDDTDIPEVLHNELSYMNESKSSSNKGREMKDCHKDTKAQRRERAGPPPPTRWRHGAIGKADMMPVML